jgi:hypothetical protein
MICWGGPKRDAFDPDVFGQVFTSGGIKKGPEFYVNSYTVGYQNDPRIVSLPNGGFVVCWASDQQDGSGTGVYGQVFSSNGNKTDQEFRINDYTENNQYNHQIASLPDGGFVVCWEGIWLDRPEVYGQVFSKEGNKIGHEFQMNDNTEDRPSSPQIVSLPDGGFVVCWVGYNRYGEGSGVYGQLFSMDGSKTGLEFRINDDTESNQGYLQIVSLRDGDFVTCWINYDYYTSSCCAKRFPQAPINHPLIPFNLLEPSNDSSIMKVTANLKWQEPSAQMVCYPWELHYKVMLDGAPDFLSPQIIEQDMDTTIFVQNLRPGTTYFWKVLAKNIAGDSLWSSNTNGFFVSINATGIAEEKKLNPPSRFVLHPNFPNPFNPETSIRFDLPSSGFVTISIYDIFGKLVKVLSSESRNAGNYSMKWDGRGSAGIPVSSGIYICRMEVQSANGERFVQSVKMGLVR